MKTGSHLLQVPVDGGQTGPRSFGPSPIGRGLLSFHRVAFERVLFEGPDGRVRFHTPHDVFSLEDGDWFDRSPEWGTRRALTAADGTYWQANARGLCNADQCLARLAGLDSQDVRDIAEDAQGGLWLATAAGAARYRGGLFHNFELGDGDAAYTVIVDRENRVYVGADSGVFVYEGNGFQSIESAAGTRVEDLAVDPDGALWAAADDAGFLRRGLGGVFEVVLEHERGSASRVDFTRGGLMVGIDARGSFTRDQGGRIEVLLGNGDIFVEQVEPHRVFTTSGEVLYELDVDP